MKGLLLTCLFFSMSVFAKINLVDKQASGYGADYQEALTSALMDAVRQVRGLQVSTEKQFKLDFEHVIKDKTEKKQATIGVVEDVFTRSKGWVHSYSVVSTQKPKDNNDSWKVTILAKIPMSDSAIKDDKRNSIAVMPFRFAHATFSVDDLGKPSDAYQVSGRIRDRVQTAFTQTQQFAVVNRSFGSEFASEKALLSSDNVSPTEASRLGNVVGADFMVVGNIYDLSTKVEEKDFYGMKQITIKDRIDMSYQLIEVASQKVLWADTISQELDRKKDETPTKTLDAVAMLILSGVMDVFYPIKVLDVVSEDEIYLNQGSARLKVEDALALYSAGRVMKDPDSGREIKIEGRKLGVLTIVETMATHSLAKLTEGELNKVKPGAIVRMLKAEEKPDPYKDKEVRATAGSSEAPVKW
ncbi:MAG: curli biogenesis system outer membrane secretion channel CsgG [Oleiphilaceae bacterium]|jgi:curli biogenesis system outer membrane secretion channel CsgG